MGGTSGAILVERQDTISVLTLNRPDRLNAASRELHAELSTVWAKIGAEPDLRAVVLTGSGRAFSAGGDADLLEAMTEDETLRRDVLAEGAEIVRAMVEFPLPIVAAVNGPAVGLGWSLASSCDLVVMAEDAFFADPHVAIGLVAGDGGALTLPLMAGLLRAKEYVLLGDRLPAADALRVGVANRVVPGDEVLSVALDIAGRFAALPQQAVVETKRLLNVALKHSIDTSLDNALTAEAVPFTTDDFRRNLAAMRKR